MRHTHYIALAARLAVMLCCAALSVSAQSVADASIHTVAYFDVAPSADTATRSALQQYRDASSKAAGYARIAALEQLDQPGRFVVLETWRDMSALEEHHSSAATVQLQKTLQAVRLSNYDQRPYRTLISSGEELRSPDKQDKQTIWVVTHVDIGGPTRDASALLQQFAEDTRMDSGNIHCAVLQGATRSNHFTAITAWKDQDAYLAHRAASHTREFRNAVEPLTGSPLDERLYKLIN